ncbi:hypothetical protein B0H14DRAFT_2576041 [Mycena olivaceomarginata]|nr:hypothetical protein B0H14DRAFT_2576041 [Mycena olivaceomarginata]
MAHVVHVETERDRKQNGGINCPDVDPDTARCTLSGCGVELCETQASPTEKRLEDSRTPNKHGTIDSDEQAGGAAGGDRASGGRGVTSGRSGSMAGVIWTPQLSIPIVCPKRVAVVLGPGFRTAASSCEGGGRFESELVTSPRSCISISSSVVTSSAVAVEIECDPECDGEISTRRRAEHAELEDSMSLRTLGRSILSVGLESCLEHRRRLEPGTASSSSSRVACGQVVKCGSEVVATSNGAYPVQEGDSCSRARRQSTGSVVNRTTRPLRTIANRWGASRGGRSTDELPVRHGIARASIAEAMQSDPRIRQPEMGNKVVRYGQRAKTGRAETLAMEGELDIATSRLGSRKHALHAACCSSEKCSPRGRGCRGLRRTRAQGTRGKHGSTADEADEQLAAFRICGGHPSSRVHGIPMIASTAGTGSPQGQYYTRRRRGPCLNLCTARKAGTIRTRNCVRRVTSGERIGVRVRHGHQPQGNLGKFPNRTRRLGTEYNIETHFKSSHGRTSHSTPKDGDADACHRGAQRRRILNLEAAGGARDFEAAGLELETTASKKRSRTLYARSGVDGVGACRRQSGERTVGPRSEQDVRDAPRACSSLTKHSTERTAYVQVQHHAVSSWRRNDSCAVLVSAGPGQESLAYETTADSRMSRPA